MPDEAGTAGAGDHQPEDRQRIEFRLLGPFELLVDGRAVEVGSPKHRILLAVLLLKAGWPVPVADLVEAIWGDDQPDNPRRAVQVYIARLRGLLAGSAPQVVITTASDAYRLDVEPDQIDLERFTAGMSRAARAAQQEDLAGEAAALAEALGHWRGKPLASLPSDLLQREVAPQLHERWLQAVERRFDVELRRGRHADMVSELIALTAEHSLREPLWARLMTALYRCGRRTEALDAYHTLRRHLADELGVDPTQDLQALYLDMLTAASSPGPTGARACCPCRGDSRGTCPLLDRNGSTTSAAAPVVISAMPRLRRSTAPGSA